MFSDRQEALFALEEKYPHQMASIPHPKLGPYALLQMPATMQHEGAKYHGALVSRVIEMDGGYQIVREFWDLASDPKSIRTVAGELDSN